MTNADKFMTAHSLSFSVEGVGERPDGDDTSWPRGSAHWKYCFRTLDNDHTVEGYFSQGPAIVCTPEAADVLVCLAMDAGCTDGMDALQFAHEMGYDLDTEDDLARVRRVFAACLKTATDLAAMLGDDGLSELLETDLEE